MAESINADLIDITKNIHPQLDDYDIIGLSSGIYFHSFHAGIKNLLDSDCISSTEKVFLVATCGIGYCDYTKGIQKLLAAKGISYLGSFQCRGYDTFGIFSKIGGIAKEHPNERDLVNAQAFAKNIMSIK